VIEQQENDTFELLQDLTIDSLREMAAFNFRKCSSAFMDSRSSGKINLEAFNLSVRWAALDKRLIATQEKIRNKKSEIRNSVQGSGSGFQQEEDQGTRGKGQEDLPVSAFAEKGRALPVIGEIRNEFSGQGPVAGGQNEVTEAGDNGVGCPEPPDGAGRDRHHCQEDDDAGKLPIREFSEAEEKQFMRETLMYEAMDRKDRAAYDAAARASDPELERLWKEFLERETENGFAFIEKICAFGAEPEDPPPEEGGSEEVVLPDFAMT
jgi:hypothetical protein